MRASQRVATPWASKDYCDYSEHCLHTICRSATCFSRTPAVARQYLFRTANGTASSHRQLAAVRRPVSGEAARSGLAEQRAVLCCGGAEQAAAQSKATRKAAAAASRPPRTTQLSTCMCLDCAHLFSLGLPSLSALPSSLLHTRLMNPSTNPPPPLLHHTHMCL